MLRKLSLRLRILLFFCLLAAGAVALAAGALAFGWSRSVVALPTPPFVTAFLIFAFVNTGLVVGVWLLFDEHVAKPINRLSADLRLRAHSGVAARSLADEAVYLGDLAPAAEALTTTMDSSVMDTASAVARETQRLRAETERLTALLTESPIATLLLNPAHEIVLYDAQAAQVLASIAAPRLRAPLADYFDITPILQKMEFLSADMPEVPITLHATTGDGVFQARLKALGQDGHMIFIDAPQLTLSPDAARPLVFDFDLMETKGALEIMETPLADLCFVPFDTETTGLSVKQDHIIQVGAVRVLNGRIVEGEAFDTYVDPGCPIPAASTQIHHITDADVAGAPDALAACRAFHQFARDAVLVAHNAPFDIGLLRKYAPEAGVDWTHPVLDTVLLSAVVFGTTEEHDLDALCDRLEVTIPEAARHTALGDAQATAAVLVKLLPLLEGRGLRTFGDVVAETQKHGRLLEDLNS